MKAKEIKALSPSELDAKLTELKDELFKLRFQQAINQLDNPMRISAVKKTSQESKPLCAMLNYTALKAKEREDF